MPEANEDTPTGRKKSGFRTILVVVALLVGEGALIFGAMQFVAGPAEVSGKVALPQDQPEEEKLVEVLVLEARLPNNRSGIAYIYDTEIYIQVKRKHEAPVSEELERFRNEIKAEVTAIWKTAEPRHFQEPRMENLTRKIDALLQQRFGTENESGEPIVQKTVIVSGTGFRVDS